MTIIKQLAINPKWLESKVPKILLFHPNSHTEWFMTSLSIYSLQIVCKYMNQLLSIFFSLRSSDTLWWFYNIHLDKPELCSPESPSLISSKLIHRNVPKSWKVEVNQHPRISQDHHGWMKRRQQPSTDLPTSYSSRSHYSDF